MEISFPVRSWKLETIPRRDPSDDGERTNIRRQYSTQKRDKLIFPTELRIKPSIPSPRNNVNGPHHQSLPLIKPPLYPPATIHHPLLPLSPPLYLGLEADRQMAAFIRAKRVSDPLDDKVKARLRGDDAHRITDYASDSSGRRHEAATSLSALVHAFLLENAAGSPSAAVAGDHASDQGSTSDDDAGDRAAAAVETVRDLLDPPAERDPFRARLVSDVLAAVEAFAGVRNNGSAFRRAVTAKLMAAGYNAGICKARWEASRRVTAGTYEYIDVVAAVGRAGEMRYIVDLEFAAEFEVARATEEYGLVLAALPRVAVAGPEEVRQVVRVVADAARRSLRSRGLHVPPWRKSRYVLAKWLGPYRRTVNALPASA